MIRINTSPISDLSLQMPLNGAWSAEIHCADIESFSVGKIVQVFLPEQVLTGRVTRSNTYAGRVHVRVIGGRIDWQKEVAGLNYTKVETDKILSDMSVQLDQAIGGQLAFWTRVEGTVGQAVQMLARHLGFNWRINPDGTVRIREESPAKVDADAIETYRDESKGMIELAVEKATVVPGCLVGEDSVGDVVYSLETSGRLCCKYWTEGRGRMLERYIRWAVRDTMYHGEYTCKVVRQADDGSLDLMPEDERLRGTGLQGVRLIHGLPGCEVKVPQGERVLLRFDNGDPSKPYAGLWHEGQVTEINLGGKLKVAIADLVKAELDKIQQKFDAHTHITACPAGAGTAASPAAHIIGIIADIASKILGTK